MEYEDECFKPGEEVIRLSFFDDGRTYPEIRAKITSLYADGVNVKWHGLDFLLSYDTYGQSWFYSFDFRHLEYVVRSFHADRKHIQLLIESWGEIAVLAAASNAGSVVYSKVLEQWLNE